MGLLGKLKPKFWDHYDVASGPQRSLFNFRRIWFLTVLWTAGVSLLPLIFIMVLDYRATRKGIESEIRLRTVRLVSTAEGQVTFSWRKGSRPSVYYPSPPLSEFWVLRRAGTGIGKPETKLRRVRRYGDY